MIDLKESAAEAAWFGGLRQFSPELSVIEFGVGYAESGGHGYVQTSEQVNNETEDGGSSPYLHTNPATGQAGLIVGIYDSYSVQPGEHFSAEVGFINGATNSDGVIFRFGYIPQGSDIDRDDFFSPSPTAQRNLQTYYHELSRVDKRYTSSLTPIEVDLSFLAGQRVQFVLIAETGARSGQDWAAWVNPTVSTRHRITVRNLFCIQESTSGWSSRRRRLRRERFSDEVAFMVLMRGLDSAGNFSNEGVTELRTRTGVDSAESVSVPPVDARFSDNTTRVLLWVKGLEIDGVGRTEELAQEAFNDWAGYLFFHPNRFSGWDAAHWSFSSAGNGDHGVLFEDYWAVDVGNLRAGGLTPDVFGVVSQRSDGPDSVESYLQEKSITREINVNRSASMTVETRRYQAADEYSDYSVDVVYR